MLFPSLSEAQALPLQRVANTSLHFPPAPPTSGFTYTNAFPGLSFGGRVVLHTALTAPRRVRGIALLDAVVDGVDWDPESVDALEAVGRAVTTGGLQAGRRAWTQHPLFAAAGDQPHVAARLTEMVNDFPGQHWLGQDPQLPFQPPMT